MNSIPWCTACFSVKVKTLYKDAMVTNTADPYVTFTNKLQLYTLANVQSANMTSLFLKIIRVAVTISILRPAFMMFLLNKNSKC